MKTIIFFLAACAVAMTSSSVSAQRMAYDENLHKQIRSIAGSKWDFGPGFEYWLTHQNYSGAKMKYKFPFSFKIEFDENRANVKRLWRPQLAELGETMVLKEKVKQQNENISAIYKEQVSVYADRMNNASKLIYDSDFKVFQSYMEKALTYVLTKSSGRGKPVVDRLKKKYDIIVDQYAYVTDLAPTPGAVVAGAMESGAREKELARIRKEMDGLVRQTKDVVMFCNIAY